MIVVADAGPIHCLVLIGAIEVLGPLYGKVLIPKTVSEELKSIGAPHALRTWLDHVPDWFEVVPDPPAERSNEALDPGESAAIALAISIRADRLLVDDWEGRVEAQRRHLSITGALGVLAEAHRHKLLDFETALARLAQTNFYLSADLVNRLRRFLTEQKGS